MSKDKKPPVEIDMSGKRPVITLENLTRISILQIGEVQSHRIMRSGENTTHEITFLDGGTVRITYTKAGKVLEFEGRQITQHISNGTEITLEMLNKDVLK